MFFIPLHTDAPIYYRPFGTIGLIVLNVAVFALVAMSPESLHTWALPRGHGLTPIAWFTSNFIHGDVLHLLGNMLFLWGFGLLVEGKLGWRRFVSIYLLIGAVECALEQLVFQHGDGISFGASAVIFGLMAISLIWAPKNDLTIFYWLFFRGGLMEMPILWFALLTFGKSLLFLSLAPQSSGELLHLMGAGVGAGVALYMLWTNKVDCEGWDLLSVLRGTVPDGEGNFSWAYQEERQRRRSKRTARRANRPTQKIPLRPAAGSPQRFSNLMQQRKVQSAFQELIRIRHFQPGWKPSVAESLALARGLRKLRQWDGSVTMYREVLLLRPDFSLARLELAEILVLIQERPAAARRILDQCDLHELSPRQVERLELLGGRIQSLIDSGVLEIDGGV